MGLVSSGPGWRLLGALEAPLVATGMRVATLGSIQGRSAAPASPRIPDHPASPFAPEQTWILSPLEK